MSGPVQARVQLPWRLRLSAIVCMLLLLFASTAQVAHHHVGDLPQTAGSRHDAPAPQKNSETLCPLCIAMHSVLPTATAVVVAPVALQHEAHPPAPAPEYLSRWRFQFFERPPPQPVRS